MSETPIIVSLQDVRAYLRCPRSLFWRRVARVRTASRYLARRVARERRRVRQLKDEDLRRALDTSFERVVRSVRACDPSLGLEGVVDFVLYTPSEKICVLAYFGSSEPDEVHRVLMQVASLLTPDVNHGLLWNLRTGNRYPVTVDADQRARAIELVDSTRNLIERAAFKSVPSGPCDACSYELFCGDIA